MKPGGKLAKLQRAPAYLAHISKAVNPIIEILNKGFIVNSDDIVAERLPDGRVQLKLNPMSGQ